MQLKEKDTIFHNWKIKNIIGEGSFGVVYEIEREEFGYTYKAAAKVISIPKNRSEYMDALDEGMTEENVTEYYLSMVEDIINECVILEKMKGDSHIVSYEDHEVISEENEIGWKICIRMELLKPLTAHLKENEIRETDVIQLGIDICRGLETCEKFNIIHRDIKPENIFISNTMNYKLGDFGISRTMERSEMAVSKKGTQIYMAPEVYKGEQYDASVDMYSLGLVLYRLMNDNRIPFLPPLPQPIRFTDKEDAIKRRINGESIPLPRNASEEFGKVILKACQFNPNNRYRSPKDMRRALEKVLELLENEDEGKDDKLYPVLEDIEDTVGTIGRNKVFGKIEILEEQKRREEARKKAEEEARRKAEEEARRRAEEEARRKAEEEARRRAEEEARRKAEEEARRRAEEEARRKAEEEARRRAEEEARRKAEEEARRRAEEEARRKAEEEARRRAEEEARRKVVEEEQRRIEAENRRKAAEEEQRRIEAENRRKAAEEEQQRLEAEARRKAEEARRKAEEEAKRRVEEEAKRKAEEAKIRLNTREIKADEHEDTKGIKLASSNRYYVDKSKLAAVNNEQSEKKNVSPVVKNVNKTNNKKLLYLIIPIAVIVFGIIMGISFTTKVPDMTGKSLAEAEELLTESKLKKGVVSYSFSADIPKDTIISQQNTSKFVKKNSRIDLIVSKGLESINMPDLTNKSIEEAQTLLQAINMNIVITSCDGYSLSIQEGDVCAQLPLAEEILKNGETVMLYISKGAMPMPEVVGLSKEEAIELFANCGITPNLQEIYSKDVEVGRIVSQNIEKDTPIDGTINIVLEVSIGVEMMVVPNVVGLTKDAAIDELINAGFKKKKINVVTEYNNSIEAGYVISQETAEGMQVEVGNGITIHVSLGAAKQNTPSKTTEKPKPDWEWDVID